MTKFAKWAAVAAVLALLCSCSLLEKIEAVERQVVEKTAEIKAAVAAADQDGDGKIVGMAEITALISGLLAVFGIGKGMAAQKVAAKVERETDELWDKTVAKP